MTNLTTLSNQELTELEALVKELSSATGAEYSISNTYRNYGLRKLEAEIDEDGYRAFSDFIPEMNPVALTKTIKRMIMNASDTYTLNQILRSL